MTRRKSLQTIHEPFGDAFYYGPERLGARFENDEKARIDSGFADSTYKTIMDRIDSEASEVRYHFLTACVITVTLEIFPLFILFHRPDGRRFGGPSASRIGVLMIFSNKHQPC